LGRLSTCGLRARCKAVASQQVRWCFKVKPCRFRDVGGESPTSRVAGRPEPRGLGLLRVANLFTGRPEARRFGLLRVANLEIVARNRSGSDCCASRTLKLSLVTAAVRIVARLEHWKLSLVTAAVRIVARLEHLKLSLEPRVLRLLRTARLWTTGPEMRSLDCRMSLHCTNLWA